MSSSNLNSEIGNRIRLIREAQGKTREQISALAEISSHFLYNLEGLLPEQLNLAEQFIETFSIGAQTKRKIRA